MAEVALKPEKIEKAIQSVVAKLPKEIAQRQWTPAAHAALILFIVENCGAKLDKTVREEIVKQLNDSDVQYTSNMRAYLVKRGILPAKPEVAQSSFLS